MSTEYPMGALREPPSAGGSVYFVYDNGRLVKEAMRDHWSGQGLRDWNISGTSDQFPHDFVFTNYWFAYAYSLNRKRQMEPTA